MLAAEADTAAATPSAMSAEEEQQDEHGQPGQGDGRDDGHQSTAERDQDRWPASRRRAARLPHVQPWA